MSFPRGVLETLIRRHFPSPTAEPGLAGIDWSLIDNDPTLPRSCLRRRQRKKPVPGQAEEFMSDSDESSDSPERSDSAVESSSDEEGRSSEGSGSSSSEEGDDEDDDDGDDDNDVNPFGSDFSGKLV